MIKAVADTNVFISALMFGGLPGAFLDLALVRIFLLAISPALLDELVEKLRLKFGVWVEDVLAVRAKLLSVAELAAPDFTLDVVGDDPDDARRHRKLTRRTPLPEANVHRMIQRRAIAAS